jgi:hypothetical protein
MVGLERRRNLRLDAVFFCAPPFPSMKKAGMRRLQIAQANAANAPGAGQ